MSGFLSFRKISGKQLDPALTYFNSLNYTIGNEDTALELEILPENTHHVFAVAGSGSRIIPLLAKNPRFITAVDSSVEQLSFAELRIASLKALDHGKFLAFWGYPLQNMAASKNSLNNVLKDTATQGIVTQNNKMRHFGTLPMHADERKNVFNNLIISDRARKITTSLFEQNRWKSLLYAGRWEQTFQKLSRLNRRIVGEKGLGVFACQSRKEQENYLKTKFPQRAWSLSVFLLGNAIMFNALLYKGNFPKKNIQQSIHSFYMKRFEHLFKQDLVRKNYFLQLLFFGKLQFAEGLPIECNQNIFLRAKRGLQGTHIKYVLGDVVEEVKHVTLSINFLSLSDVPSYLVRPKEQEFLQDIKKNISTNGIVVNRYYLRIPENLNTDGYKNITENFKNIITEEKVQMYSFGIYQKI